MNPSKQLTALENDIKAVRLIQRMTIEEREKLAAKLLLLSAQFALEHHGEFKLASQIGDFLSTPFASTEGEQVSCGHGAQREAATGFFRLFHASSETPAGIHFASTPDEAQGHTSRVVAGENGGHVREVNPSAPAISPRTPPSNAGSGAVCGARPRIVLCNPERKSIVRSAEERGK